MTKIGSFLTELFKKIKMWSFFGTQCTMLEAGKTHTVVLRHLILVKNHQSTDLRMSRRPAEWNLMDTSPHTRIHQSDYDTADPRDICDFPQCTRPRLQRHHGMIMVFDDIIITNMLVVCSWLKMTSSHSSDVMWRNGWRSGMALDLRSVGRGFNSYRDKAA